MFAALSLDPSISEYYESFIGLGPIAYIDHTTSLFKLLTEIHAEDIWLLLNDPKFFALSFE